MKLGIVGHAQEKFTPITEAAARKAISEEVLRYRPTHIVSGHSPMGGIDLYAEEFAEHWEIPTIIHAPTAFAWASPGGYKERNLQIAEDSDLVLVVVVRELPRGFTGMPFPKCYHCYDRNPPHVKSGGCWTAWQCEKQKWRII